MSQFYIPSPMPATIPAPRLTPFQILAAISTLVWLAGCSTPGQQLASKEIQAVNAQEMKCGPNTPYLGGYNSTDAPRLTTDTPYDALNPELSETVALPFFSFLIIEPEPVTKNAVPSDIEKLVKAQQYDDAIKLIDARLKKTPQNVQLRFLKARLQIEMQQQEKDSYEIIEEDESDSDSDFGIKAKKVEVVRLVGKKDGEGQWMEEEGLKEDVIYRRVEEDGEWEKEEFNDLVKKWEEELGGKEDGRKNEEGGGKDEGGS